jgi:hypothetical protein
LQAPSTAPSTAPLTASRFFPGCRACAIRSAAIGNAKAPTIGEATRITVLGAAYLTLVCLLPDSVLGANGLQSVFAVGGTSLLILVNVTIDTISQVQSHLLAHQYGDLLKKAKLKGGRAR